MVHVHRKNSCYRPAQSLSECVWTVMIISAHWIINRLIIFALKKMLRNINLIWLLFYFSRLQNKSNANTSQSKATNSAGSDDDSDADDDEQDPNKTHDEVSVQKCHSFYCFLYHKWWHPMFNFTCGLHVLCKKFFFFCNYFLFLYRRITIHNFYYFFLWLTFQCGWDIRMILNL